MIVSQKGVHLWLLPIQEAEIPASILFSSEQARFQKLKTPAKRAEFLHSRLLLRTALHHFLPQAPADTDVIADDNGRPFWEYNDRRLPLYFSISHTAGMAALAVSNQPEIGCDIEKIRPRRYEKELSAKVLTATEYTIYSKQQTEAAARNFFYKAWTLKEACVKAMGTGLRTPLASLDFVHSSQFSSVAERFTARMFDKNWHFYSRTLPPNYALAVAVPFPFVLSLSVYDGTQKVMSLQKEERADDKPVCTIIANSTGKKIVFT